MNCPEKIAATYLRLNGFFLLPHFTVFDGISHNHIDFLALRPPNGREVCLGLEFPIDNSLFDFLNRTIVRSPLDKLLGTLVEVKGGRNERESPSIGHVTYARNFFGNDTTLIKMAFALNIEEFIIDDSTLGISLKHSLKWTLERFDWMRQNCGRITKEGSWNLSEEFLSDLLYLKKLGFS